MENLFEPVNLNGLQLQNRMVVAPMTRRRAENKALAPDDTIALYYAQRASAGLIISEGSQVSPTGYGYLHTPGCYSDDQLAGWKKVTRAVHEKGGKIFLQLWHVGAYSHPLLQPGEALPVSSSAFTPEGQVLTPHGQRDYITTRALTTEEVYQTADDFGKAALTARTAGFDGVEIHGAHTYLIDQFIHDHVNKRKDEFGGTIENRARFLFLVIDRVAGVWPSSSIGLRLSPGFARPGAGDSHPEETYGTIVEKLNDYKLAYLHLSEMISEDDRAADRTGPLVDYYRKIYHGTLISCGGYRKDTALKALNQNRADLIAFGKPFIANPDLVRRFRHDAPLNVPDKSTFYHGGTRGYTDYPFLNNAAHSG